MRIVVGMFGLRTTGDRNTEVGLRVADTTTTIGSDRPFLEPALSGCARRAGSEPVVMPSADHSWLFDCFLRTHSDTPHTLASVLL